MHFTQAGLACGGPGPSEIDSAPALEFLELNFMFPFPCPSPLLFHDRLVGLVVRRPPRERKVPGSNPACGEIFLGSSHTSVLNTGTPVATLPGAWSYRVSAGTGRPGVSIL